LVAASEAALCALRLYRIWGKGKKRSVRTAGRDGPISQRVRWRRARFVPKLIERTAGRRTEQAPRTLARAAHRTTTGNSESAGLRRGCVVLLIWLRTWQAGPVGRKTCLPVVSSSLNKRCTRADCKRRADTPPRPARHLRSRRGIRSASPSANHSASRPASRLSNHAATRRESRIPSRRAYLSAIPRQIPSACPPANRVRNRGRYPSANPHPSRPGNRSRNGSGGGSRGLGSSCL
jgi:hypothetical protein